MFIMTLCSCNDFATRQGHYRQLLLFPATISLILRHTLSWVAARAPLQAYAARDRNPSAQRRANGEPQMNKSIYPRGHYFSLITSRLTEVWEVVALQVCVGGLVGVQEAGGLLHGLLLAALALVAPAKGRRNSAAVFAGGQGGCECTHARTHTGLTHNGVVAGGWNEGANGAPGKGKGNNKAWLFEPDLTPLQTVRPILNLLMASFNIVFQLAQADTHTHICT